MSGVRKEQGVAPDRDRPDHTAVPAPGNPAQLLARPHVGDARVINGNVMADSRSPHHASGRPSLPAARPNPDGLSRQSNGSASTTPIQASRASSVPGSAEPSPSSRADGRSSLGFVPNDAFIGRLQASKAKMSARPKTATHYKPDSTGSSGNPPSARASMGGTRTDRASPSSSVVNVDSGPSAVADRHKASPMEVDRSNATPHPMARNLTPGASMNTSSATRSIIPQNRKESTRPSITGSDGLSFSIRGLANLSAAPLVTQHESLAQNFVAVGAETNRVSTANQSPLQSPRPASSRKSTGPASPPPPPPRISRSPSFEILDEATFQRTTPSKKRKLSAFPPSDVPSSARGSVQAQASTTSDLSSQEVELLSGIESHAEAVPLDLLESLLEDEDMATIAQEDTDASNRKIPSLSTLAASVTSSTSADANSRLAGWKAPHNEARTNGNGRNQDTFASLIDAVNKAADAHFSEIVAFPKTASSTSIAKDESLPRSSVSTVKLDLPVPLSANASASSQDSSKLNGQPAVFKIPHPVVPSLKGKEPVRPPVPFERQASPPQPIITTVDLRDLWKKEAMAMNAGTLPKDVDSLLHSGQEDDDPFVVSNERENAEAGPSFKHSPVPESAYIHMLPEPRGSAGMTKDFDYRKFNEPLLDCINSLPDHAQNPSHIRVILEAYYSQSTLDRAPAIKIHGGEYDEYPPPEFKYSDEVYYSEKVPKPWLGKGCECIGPCSENSPLKGFAHNDDGTLKDCQYPTWECGPQCDCPPACKNRVMQKGRSPKVQLQIYKTSKKGWGVRALSSFPKGTFVGLYSGEVIPEEETDARGEIYNAIERTYLFDLDHWHIKQPPENLASIDPAGAFIAQQAAAILQEEDKQGDDADDDSKGTMFNSFFTVDAFHWGFTRFFNHSCDPNLVLSAAYFDDFDVRKPRLAITAKKDIRKGDELCISYLGPPDDDELPPMIETDEQLRARTGTKDNGKRGVVKKRKGGTAHKQKASQTKTPEKVEVGRCHCGAKNCMGYMFNAYSKG